MSSEKLSEPIRCLAIIATATAVIVIVDLIARAFFYGQAQRFAPYQPLLIGSIALITLGITRKYRNKTEIAASTKNPTGARRVRVTGPVK